MIFYRHRGTNTRARGREREKETVKEGAAPFLHSLPIVFQSITAIHIETNMASFRHTEHSCARTELTANDIKNERHEQQIFASVQFCERIDKIFGT